MKWTEDYTEFIRQIMDAVQPEVPYNVTAYVTEGRPIRGTTEIEDCTEQRMFIQGAIRGPDNYIAGYKNRGLRFDNDTDRREHETECVTDTLKDLSKAAASHDLEARTVRSGLIRFVKKDKQAE